MAWLWWLLAPLASTAGGALLLTLRTPAGSRGRRDTIAEHQALLAALPQPKAGDPEPVTMRVIEPDRSPSALG